MPRVMFDQMSRHLWLIEVDHEISLHTCQLEKLPPLLPGRHGQGKAVRSRQKPGVVHSWMFLPMGIWGVEKGSSQEQAVLLDSGNAKNEYKRVPDTKNYMNRIKTLKYFFNTIQWKLTEMKAQRRGNSIEELICLVWGANISCRVSFDPISKHCVFHIVPTKFDPYLWTHVGHGQCKSSYRTTRCSDQGGIKEIIPVKTSQRGRDTSMIACKTVMEKFSGCHHRYTLNHYSVSSGSFWHQILAGEWSKNFLLLFLLFWCQKEAQGNYRQWNASQLIL